MSSVIISGATLALGKSFSASRFWDEAIAHDATAFIYIGEVCRYLLNQPAKPTDRAHRVRVIAGNGLRPEIWEEFTKRFGIARVCEFYAASEGTTAFINIFNVPRSTGISPMPLAYVEYDPDTGTPLRDESGRVRRVPAGEPGLLLSPVNKLSPFDGYTDKEATEKKLVRNAFREGDCWFNTGDVMSPQGKFHAAFVDRLGDTFRWKGENVATTQVEAAVSSDAGVEECTVYGVEVPRTGGRAGMAAVKLREGAEFDGKSLARAVYDALPAYALPLFVRVVSRWNTRRRSRAARSSCASRRMAARSRTRCTCWPAATRAMCRSTTPTPKRWRAVSDRRGRGVSRLKPRTPSSACRVRGLRVAMAAAVQRVPRPPHDVVRLVLGDHPDDDPPQFLQFAQPPLVTHVPPTVAAVLVTVVLGGHLVFLPAHIEYANEAPVLLHRDLRGGNRQARVDQQQPEPRLLRRGSARVDQRKSRPQPPQATRARVPLGEQ